MMFGFVGAIAFDTFGTLYSAWESCVSLFPAILALENAKVHVRSPDGSDVVADIEAPID